jgi:hypothetical protein
MAVLSFRSGLKMMVGASPAKLWVNGLASSWPSPKRGFQSAFGAETMHSDYNFLKMLYAFTPEHMHLWALSPRVHYRELMLLNLKSVALFPPEGEIELTIFRADHQNLVGVSQAEINRIVQSLRKPADGESIVSTAAAR